MRTSLIVASCLALAGIAAGSWLRLRSTEVDAVRVEKGRIEQTVVASGQMMPPAEVRIGSLVSSTVRSVFVEEGAQITEGQVLIEFDDSEALASLQQAKAQLDSAKLGRLEVATLSAPSARANLDQAEANLTLAEQRLVRERSLAEAGVTTPAQLEDAQSAMKVAEARRQEAQLQVEAASKGGTRALSASASIALAQAQLALAEEQVRRHTILAPVNGVVLTRTVEPGDSIMLGASLLRVLSVGAPRLRIEPDERNLALIQLGQKGVASTEAFPRDHFDVTVSYIAPAVNPERGTIEVHLLVKDPPDFLRPHMTTSVEVVVGRKENALVVPRRAIRSEAKDPHLLCIRSGRVESVPVELDLIGDDRISLRDGIEEGEVVLVDPSIDVRSGAKAVPRFLEAR